MAELAEIFGQLENILKTIEREPGKVDSGSALGCLKSYYETRVAQLEPELELRDKEKYESIFRKYKNEEHASHGTFCPDGRTGFGCKSEHTANSDPVRTLV